MDIQKKVVFIAKIKVSKRKPYECLGSCKYCYGVCQLFRKELRYGRRCAKCLKTFGIPKKRPQKRQFSKVDESSPLHKKILSKIKKM